MNLVGASGCHRPSKITENVHLKLLYLLEFFNLCYYVLGFNYKIIDNIFINYKFKPMVSQMSFVMLSSERFQLARY